VSKNHGLLEDEVADSSVTVVVNIAAADPDTPQTDHNVARPKNLVDGNVP
jgi:hypothetical protein